MSGGRFLFHVGTQLCVQGWQILFLRVVIKVLTKLKRYHHPVSNSLSI